MMRVLDIASRYMFRETKEIHKKTEKNLRRLQNLRANFDYLIMRCERGTRRARREKKFFAKNNLAMSSLFVVVVCLLAAAMDHEICCIIVCLQRNRNHIPDMNLLCLDSVISHFARQIISTSRNALLPLHAHC